MFVQKTKDKNVQWHLSRVILFVFKNRDDEANECCDVQVQILKYAPVLHWGMIIFVMLNYCNKQFWCP